MVYRFVENQQNDSVNFGGQFSGEVDKNTNKSKTEVSLVKAKIFKKKITMFIYTSIYSLFV